MADGGMKRLPLLLVLALAAALAGCGGSGGGATGGADGASVAPASAAVFVNIDTDLSSDQWQTVDSLLDKFPAKDRLLSEVRKSFERDAKVSWKNDVKPALGDEIDVVFLNVDAGAKVVALMQPGDEGKFDTLVRKLNASEDPGNEMVTGEFQDWKVIADKRADIDAYKRAASGSKLADDADFQDAMDALDDEALVKVYLDTPQLVRKLSAMAPALDASKTTAKTLAKLGPAGAELAAHDDGVELSGRLALTGKLPTSDYRARFVEDVPAGALLYLSFRNRSASANLRSQLGPALQAMPQLAPVFGAVTKLLPLFANENALYVLPGFPIPEVTLLTQPKSPARGTAAITRLIASLRPLLGPVPVRSTSLDGVPAKEIPLGRVSLFYGAVGPRVFLSTSRRVVSELGSNGQKLADDATFKEAMDTAGMPSTTAGFLYVNLKDAIPLAESLAQLGGVQLPPDIDTNIRHLRTFLAFGSAKAREARFTAFLGVG